MAQAIKRIQKEFNQIIKDEEDLWENGIISAGPEDDSDWYKWYAEIVGPKDTPYESGTFVLDIKFPKEYPFRPPRIFFKTKIFHFNIHYNGDICCESFYDLYDGWSPDYTLVKILYAIIDLLRCPNFDKCNLYGYDISLRLNKYGNYNDNDLFLYNKIANEWTVKYADGEYNHFYYDAETHFNKEKHKLNERIEQIISNYENELEEADKFILKLEEYICDNKKKRNEKEKIIRQIKQKLITLKNNNSNDSYKEVWKLEDFKRELNYKEEEINNFKLNIPLFIKEKLMVITIISSDESVHFSTICQNNDNFSIIEKLLYDKYPQYKNNKNYYNNYFILHGNEIDQKNNIKNNHIKDNDIIELIVKLN